MRTEKVLSMHHKISPSLRGLLLGCFSSSFFLSSSAFSLLSFISSPTSFTRASSSSWPCADSNVALQYRSDTGKSAYEFGNLRSNSFIILTTFLKNTAMSEGGILLADNRLRWGLRCKLKKTEFGSRFSSLNRYSLVLQSQALLKMLTINTIKSSLMNVCSVNKDSVAGKHRLDVKSRMISSGVLVSRSWRALNPSLTGRGFPDDPAPPRPPLPPPLPPPLHPPLAPPLPPNPPLFLSSR